MIKRALPAVLGCFSFCLAMAAQQPVSLEQSGIYTIPVEQLNNRGELYPAGALNLYRPDLFSTIDGSILLHGLPVTTLLDGRRFPLSDRPLESIPLAFLSAVRVQKTTTRPSVGSDAPGGVVDLELKRGYTTGGEVGVFYGKSGGRNGREDYEAHIIGTVGNDKVQITAGAAYQESSGRYGSYRGYSR